MINFKTVSAIALTAAVVAIAPMGNAEAALITGVTVSTNMGSFDGRSIRPLADQFASVAKTEKNEETSGYNNLSAS